METTALKTYLQEGLEIANRVAARTPTLPILGNVHLLVDKDGMRLAATDLQMGVMYHFLDSHKAEGVAVFPGQSLAALLGVSNAEHVNLTLAKHQLSAQVGEHQADLQVLDPEEFPIIPTLEGSEPFIEVDTATFCKGLGQVVGMVGQSQARPEISGVLFVIKGKALHLVSTDSFRLAERRLTLSGDEPEERRAIVPAKTCRELIAILGDRPGKTKIYFSISQIVFLYEEKENPSKLRVQVVSRLIEGEYPQYEDVIPSTHKTHLVISKKEFVDQLKATGIFAGKTQEIKLLIDPKKKEIEFSSENKESGRHRSTVKAEIDGEQVEVAFNWRFLLEGLSHLQGDQIEFGLNGEEGAAFLRAGKQDGYTYVIMPIKA